MIRVANLWTPAARTYIAVSADCPLSGVCRKFEMLKGAKCGINCSVIDVSWFREIRKLPIYMTKLNS